MIADNAIFWQAVVFAVFGYVTAITCNALFGFPRRLVESM